MSRRTAVVGGGWAGISAAVAATEAGHRVTLFEMAPQLGGRARRVDRSEPALDNGQHILIGAYRETLSLMRRVGADPDALLRRLPLALVDPMGDGLRLPGGAPVPAFVRAVLGHRGWSLGERIGVLVAALHWRFNGFEAGAQTSVAELTRGLSARVRHTLIEPLCVAALNTPAQQASARIFLRVLRDALFAGPGSADLLLPRAPLSALLPDPAAAWLEAAGADLRRTTRVNTLTARADGWDLDGQPFDGVVLACTATEAARLTLPVAPAWSRQAAAFDYEPIVTVYLQSRGTRLAQPMTALASSADAPAQFAFDLGAIDGDGTRDGLFAFVVSGARAWVERGLDATAAATLQQAQTAFAAHTWRTPPILLRTLAERRATFLCTPGLARPPTAVGARLAAAGDYVDGPYPATLEGAVRSGVAAIAALGAI
ncbi:MAG: hydroxysqualene dehydroxylase HpnE [Burkholderiaceae bacterium]|nr:hydroxysqualene dehydroxylase HpnE [Burkholderiaceae bacterium]